VDNVLGSNDALSAVVTGLGVATIVAGVVVVVCAVFVVAERVRNHRSAPQAPATSAGQAAATLPPTVRPTMTAVPPPGAQGPRPALPVGAEAALQAIVELGSDPRTVVVTHRDPTGEIRLHPLPTGNAAPAARPDLARSA